MAESEIGLILKQLNIIYKVTTLDLQTNHYFHPFQEFYKACEKGRQYDVIVTWRPNKYAEFPWSQLTSLTISDTGSFSKGYSKYAGLYFTLWVKPNDIYHLDELLHKAASHSLHPTPAQCKPDWVFMTMVSHCSCGKWHYKYIHLASHPAGYISSKRLIQWQQAPSTAAQYAKASEGFLVHRCMHLAEGCTGGHLSPVRHLGYATTHSNRHSTRVPIWDWQLHTHTHWL